MDSIELEREILRLAADDWLAPWQVARLALRFTSNTADANRVAKDAVSRLVLAGKLVIGAFDDQGQFSQSRLARRLALDEMVGEWNKLRDKLPDIGDVGWLALTPLGEKAMVDPTPE